MKVIVFDIDGVLADATHRVHYVTGEKKDWDAFYEACDKDEPIIKNVKLLDILLCGRYDDDGNKQYEIALLTGRPEKLRVKTVLWFINKCDVIITAIPMFMRKDNDYRPDYVVKKELAEQCIGLENILCVFEDRDRVVKMWRENDVQCHQTCDGTY